jgi:hypothetical protein
MGARTRDRLLGQVIVGKRREPRIKESMIGTARVSTAQGVCSMEVLQISSGLVTVRPVGGSDQRPVVASATIMIEP